MESEFWIHTDTGTLYSESNSLTTGPTVELFLYWYITAIQPTPALHIKLLPQWILPSNTRDGQYIREKSLTADKSALLNFLEDFLISNFLLLLISLWFFGFSGDYLEFIKKIMEILELIDIDNDIKNTKEIIKKVFW